MHNMSVQALPTFMNSEVEDNYVWQKKVTLTANNKQTF